VFPLCLFCLTSGISCATVVPAGAPGIGVFSQCLRKTFAYSSQPFFLPRKRISGSSFAQEYIERKFERDFLRDFAGRKSVVYFSVFGILLFCEKVAFKGHLEMMTLLEYVCLGGRDGFMREVSL
jgi:hypothetical protein